MVSGYSGAMTAHSELSVVLWRGRASGRRRERVSGASGECVALMCPLWPDRLGQPWCMAATRHSWPMAGRPLACAHDADSGRQ